MKKYIIDTKDPYFSGSGCDTLFDTREEAERHLLGYTEKERKELEVVEIEA